MDTSKIYPSKYISSEDLKGREITVTISGLKMELLKDRNGQQVAKPILYFQGSKKGLVVNKTNLKKLWDSLGSRNSNDWSSKQIILYSVPVQFGDEIRDGIRIKAVGNGAVKGAPVIDPDDDVPPFDIPDGDANEDVISDDADPFK